MGRSFGCVLVCVFGCVCVRLCVRLFVCTRVRLCAGVCVVGVTAGCVLCVCVCV